MKTSKNNKSKGRPEKKKERFNYKSIFAHDNNNNNRKKWNNKNKIIRFLKLGMAYNNNEWLGGHMGYGMNRKIENELLLSPDGAKLK